MSERAISLLAESLRRLLQEDFPTSGGLSQIVALAVTEMTSDDQDWLENKFGHDARALAPLVVEAARRASAIAAETAAGADS